MCRAAQTSCRISETKHVANDTLRFVKKSAAAVGHIDPTRRPAEQRKSGFILEQFDLLAHRGLRNA
jgi:hypothetical protein